MVTVRLKGVNPVRDARTGEMRYYAWRGKGAPRLQGVPGSPEFVASYNEAMQSRRPADNGAIRGLVAGYRASPDYLELAASTRRQWEPWLTQIVDYFGAFPLAAFDRHERIKPIIRKWRDQFRDTPRKADYALQVLSRLLSYAVDAGRLGSNPCFGFKKLHTGNRSEVVWSDTDIDRMKAAAPAWLGRMIALAVNTGLRRGDLIKLCWSHIGPDAIEIRTGKSKGKITAIIPLHDDLKDAVAAIPKRGPRVLTYDDSRRPVTADGFTSAWRRAWVSAGMGEADLRFNDLRGTAVTRLYLSGLTYREIAEVAGWTEGSVEKIIRRYVGPGAAMRDRIERINKTQRGTDFAK